MPASRQNALTITFGVVNASSPGKPGAGKATAVSVGDRVEPVSMILILIPLPAAPSDGPQRSSAPITSRPCGSGESAA
jgi:hypothetical protein